MDDSLTLEQLKPVAMEWQNRLSLADWWITYRIVPPGEIEGNRALCERPTPNKRMALIKIADPAIVEPDLSGANDWEESLVHELLHLHLWEMADALEHLKELGGALIIPLIEIAGRQHLQAEERAVHALSRALVVLKRETLKGGDSSGKRSAGPAGD